MSKTSEKTVVPGQVLAEAEEYMPGPGTFEAGGKVLSAVLGMPVFDETEKTVSVKALRTPRMLAVDDLVLGMITGVTNSMVQVHLLRFDDGTEIHGSDTRGIIHISKVRRGYTEDARRAFRHGDLVRARVIQVSPAVQLATNEDITGVLAASCIQCRRQMLDRAGSLYCPHCRREETRELASDFSRFTPACGPGDAGERG